MKDVAGCGLSSETMIRRVFLSSQATGKVLSTEHVIYSKFYIYLELVSVGKL